MSATPILNTFNPADIPQRPPGRLDVIQRLVIHEAGHATVAAYLRQAVEVVAIWYKPAGSPELRIAAGHAQHRLGKSTPLDQVAVFTAGDAAVSLADPSVVFADFERYEPGDYWLIGQALDQLGPAPKPERRKQIIERQWQRSRTILAGRWVGVVDLANALIDEGKAEEERTGSRLEVRAEISGPRLAALLAFTKS